MEKVLLCNSLHALKALGQSVGIVFHNALHPDVHGERRIKAEAEQQGVLDKARAEAEEEIGALKEKVKTRQGSAVDAVVDLLVN